jgi:hypothetical protein
MEYKSEDYIKFIEQKRFDKIGAWGMEIIAKKYRRLEHNKGKNLPLDSVRLSCLQEVWQAWCESTQTEDFDKWLHFQIHGA